jgi:hypothetical protein
MHNLPRLPVRFLQDNNELLKSMEVLSGGMAGEGTDYEITESIGQAEMEPQYRAPMDRVNGNEVFRRYPNGDLDLENAKNVVVDIIHKVKDKGPLTELEKLILGCMYPLMFAFVDPRLASQLMIVQLRLAPWECAMVCQAVDAHLITEMNYNSGIGGGGDPGRTQTRS